MDEIKIREFLGRASEIYSSATGCMAGLQRWSESFLEPEEKILAGEIYQFVLSKNRFPSTRVFSIDSILQEDFLRYFSQNNPPQ